MMPAFKSGFTPPADQPRAFARRARRTQRTAAPLFKGGRSPNLFKDIYNAIFYYGIISTDIVAPLAAVPACSSSRAGRRMTRHGRNALPLPRGANVAISASYCTTCSRPGLRPETAQRPPKLPIRRTQRPWRISRCGKASLFSLVSHLIVTMKEALRIASSAPLRESRGSMASAGICNARRSNTT